MDTSPEPHHDGHDAREENTLHRNPDFGEAAVLVNRRQVHLADPSKVVQVEQVQVELLGRVDGQPDVQQVVVVVQGAELEEEDWIAVLVLLEGLLLPRIHLVVIVWIVDVVALEGAVFQGGGQVRPLCGVFVLVLEGEACVEGESSGAFVERLVKDERLFAGQCDVHLQHSDEILLPPGEVENLSTTGKGHLRINSRCNELSRLV